MAVISPPLFVDVDGFYGADELGLPYRDLIGEGVMGYEDLRVRQRGAGANMSVDVGAGVVWVVGDESVAQPRYRCYNDAVTNVAIGAADPTNPRLDMVIAEVRDATFAGAFNDWRLRVVAGTASAGATLENRTGAAALPNNSVLLADVLVAAADSSIVDAEIRDRRPFAVIGVIPPLLTDIDMVGFIPHPGIERVSDISVGFSHTPMDGMQSAALCFLPRRIVGATRIRWKYLQSGSPLPGNYAIGIFDASGRKVVDTGSVAWAGGASTIQVRAETITTTTFEAGSYYIFMGMDSTGVGAETAYAESVWGRSNSNRPGPVAPNLFLRTTSGGTTVPQTLLGQGDMGTSTTTGLVSIPVPVIALSVG